MTEPELSEFMTVTEARLLLRVSKGKMAEWLADGTLPWVESPYNKRAKLVRREAVEELARQPRAGQTKKPQPGTAENLPAVA